jgi:hypothetical protein
MHNYALRLGCPSSHQPNNSGYLTKDKLEDVVEDEVASGSVWQKLEALAVIHRSLLLVHLEHMN